MSDNQPTPTFESALDQLQQIVKRMESGELNLEQSLKHFEDGVRFTRLCQEQLSAAEKRVEILLRNGAEGADGKPELGPFGPTRT